MAVASLEGHLVWGTGWEIQTEVADGCSICGWIVDHEVRRRWGDVTDGEAEWG